MFGGYSAAIDFFVANGGQFFPCRSPESSSTVLLGRQCFTFWEESSKIRTKTRNAAIELGFDPENQTPGRLARKVLEEIVGLEYKETFWSKRYRDMARKGCYWHYTHCTEGYYPYLLEFDLRQAYFTSLFHGSSLLYSPVQGWLDDNGALLRLKEATPKIPKSIRLTILGVLASHKRQFYTLGRTEDDAGEMVLKTVNQIKYGSAFNAAHKAVFRTYKAMEKLHSIGGEWIKRIHTDSFAIPADTPVDIEARIFDFLRDNGYRVSLKASGSSHFLGLNEGIIGRKVVGARDMVLTELREKKVKIPQMSMTIDEVRRWQERMEQEQIDLDKDLARAMPEQLRLDLFPHSSPVAA